LKELGIIYYNLKKDETAIEIYERLITLEPKNPKVRAFLGYMYYENDNLEGAIVNLNISLDISPASPFVYFVLGKAYSRAGKIKEAVDAYDFAIFMDFDIYSAHLDFARKYEAMGIYRKSLKEYRSAYDIDPRDENILNKIKEIEQKLKNL